MKDIRLMQMERYLSEVGYATIQQLCEKFEIHPNTARSAIKELIERGVAEKKYGGVGYTSTKLPEGYYEQRRETNKKSKESIGYKALALLEEGDIIFVDGGTTTSLLFEFISEMPKHLVIITNNLDVINKAFLNSDFTIYILPGKGNRELNSFVSTETIDSLKSYNVNKAFIGAKGISTKGDLSSMSTIDVKLKKTAIEISQTVILMADSQKLNNSGIVNFSSLDKVDYWVCDKNTEEICELARKHNVKLVEST